MMPLASRATFLESLRSCRAVSRPVRDRQPEWMDHNRQLRAAKPSSPQASLADHSLARAQPVLQTKACPGPGQPECQKRGLSDHRYRESKSREGGRTGTNYKEKEREGGSERCVSLYRIIWIEQLFCKENVCPYTESIGLNIYSVKTNHHHTEAFVSTHRHYDIPLVRLLLLPFGAMMVNE